MKIFLISTIIKNAYIVKERRKIKILRIKTKTKHVYLANYITKFSGPLGARAPWLNRPLYARKKIMMGKITKI